MLLLFVAADAYVQDTTSVTVRPKVGLLLSGEEAKGAAHIGVLNVSLNKVIFSAFSLIIKLDSAPTDIVVLSKFYKLFLSLLLTTNKYQKETDE